MNQGKDMIGNKDNSVTLSDLHTLDFFHNHQQATAISSVLYYEVFAAQHHHSTSSPKFSKAQLEICLTNVKKLESAYKQIVSQMKRYGFSGKTNRQNWNTTATQTLSILSTCKDYLNTLISLEFYQAA